MKVSWCLLKSGRLERQQGSFAWPAGARAESDEVWVDVEEANADELRQFLAPMALHPLQLAHCLDSTIDPGVLCFGNTVLMEYPAAFDREAAAPAYVTILLQAPVLVTIRHGPMPALDELIDSLTGDHPPELHHLAELIYQILDQFADLNVDAQMSIRDRIQALAKTIAETPAAVGAGDLSRLRWQVGNLISLLENQLYCVSRLAASDIAVLREPHRKAYVEDLVSEAEIAQRAAYRLETRVDDLYRDYQLVGSDRVEKRLRLLTIVSAITLPLGLLAGLLGMNVGGVPGIDWPAAFAIVVVLMAVIASAEYLYFRWKGWLE